MSGRSAIVRSKNDKRGSFAKTNSFSNVRVLPASGVRRDSAPRVEDYGQAHGMYPTPQPYYGPSGYQQPRDIIVESAIEKSGIRSQVDEMSDNFRGKLGRMFGGSKSSKSNSSKSPDATLRQTPTDTSLKVNDVPSLNYSASTEPYSQATSSNFGFHSSRSRTTSREHSDTYFQPEPSLSGQPRGRPEVLLLAGHRERRAVAPWKNMKHPPESLASTVDTLVKLLSPTEDAQPLALFHINSAVLRKLGCKMWLEMLEEHTPTMVGDSETISSAASIPDYNFDGASSIHSGSRHNRTLKIKYDLFLECPDDALDLSPRSWAITTRNLFAIIHDHDYLCGHTLFEALSQLSIRLKENPDGLPPGLMKQSFLVDYLNRHRYLDARNNPAYALSMLAFSQLPAIQWKEGTIESFVHCVGARLYGTFNIPEAQHVSPFTNVLITNMANDLKKRLNRAQKYFESLDFSEMWPSNIPSKSCGRAAYERFRAWLLHYLWRNDPRMREAIATEEVWMTNERIERYKKIFHSLFDYLVNRDIEIDDSSTTSGHPDAIISRSGSYFKPDPHAELPMTEIFARFDASKKFPHLPAPYPLVPASQAPLKSRYGSRKKSASADFDEELEARSSSYGAASNFELIAHDPNMDAIVAEFISFEQTDEVAMVDPRDARLGRWVLIYGALQMLATIETPTPGVRYKEGARYCMSCKVSGVLPWVKEREGEMQEARSPSHEMAHPFMAPLTWPSIASSKPHLESYRATVTAGHADGRSRPAEPSKSSSSVGRSNSLRTGFGWTGRGGLIDPPQADNPPAKAHVEVINSRGGADSRLGFSNYKPEDGW